MTSRGSADQPAAAPESVGQRLAYWQYRTIWEAAARLPEPVARRAPAAAGAAWYRLAPERQRAQLRRNLARVTGHPPRDDLEATVRAAYTSYARYWLDAFRLHRMDPADVLGRSTEEGLEHLDAFAQSGKGGILATAHLGSWDVGAFFTTQRNWGMTVVAEVLAPRRLFDRFVWLRRQAGIDVIPLVRGGDMIRQLERVIHDGGTATLLADRDLSRTGAIVEFFGEPCRLPPGPAVLARRTGRPVSVGAFVTRGDGYHAVAQEPVEIAHLSVADGTQVVACELERLIARFPEQWHVFVANWLAEREPRHPAVTSFSGPIEPGRHRGAATGGVEARESPQSRTG